jgi:hypothetical protein
MYKTYTDFITNIYTNRRSPQVLYFLKDSNVSCKGKRKSPEMSFTFILLAELRFSRLRSLAEPTFLKLTGTSAIQKQIV